MTDLPPGWEWATLGEVAQTSLGKMHDKGRSTGQNMVPYLRNVNVQWGRFDLSNILTMDIHPDQQKVYEVKSGDLLICEGGEIGRCAIWPGSATYMAYQKALHRVRFANGVEARYVRYLLENLSVNNEILSYSSGSTIKHIPQQQLRRLRFPLPPTAEQQRIVAVLEEHLSRLDVVQRMLARNDLRSASLVKSLLRDAFSGKLVRSEKTSSPEDLRYTILQERSLLRSPGDRRGRPHPAPVAQGFDFEHPDHWAAVSLEEATHPNRTISYGILKPGPNLAGGIPYVRVVNMRENIIAVDELHRTSPEIDKKYERARLSADDVLLSIRGTYGRVALVPNALTGANITQDTARLAFVSVVDPRFAAYYLQSPFAQSYFKKIARGVAVKGVNIGDLREMPMPLPSLAEQHLIVQLLEQHLSDIQVSQRSSIALLHRTRLVRASLMREAFAGRLVPQVSDDEPASMLLERIRAERAAQPKPKRTRQTRSATQEALL